MSESERSVHDYPSFVIDSRLESLFTYPFLSNYNRFHAGEGVVRKREGGDADKFDQGVQSQRSECLFFFLVNQQHVYSTIIIRHLSAFQHEPFIYQ